MHCTFTHIQTDPRDITATAVMMFNIKVTFIKIKNVYFDVHTLHSALSAFPLEMHSS